MKIEECALVCVNPYKNFNQTANDERRREITLERIVCYDRDANKKGNIVRVSDSLRSDHHFGNWVLKLSGAPYLYVHTYRHK